MTLPANVRVNTSTPFPALVKASGPLTILKQNGIWTIGFTFAGLGQLPSGVDPTQVQVMVFNAVSNTYQIATLAQIQSSSALATTVTHAMSPYAPKSSDVLLLVDTTGGTVEIDLALSASRASLELSIKDAKGNAFTNNITIKPQSAPAETIDNYTNASPLVLNANFDGVKLKPIPGGYIIAP